MGGVSVYELDPVTFRLRRHISAERAYWSGPLKTWVFENGWRRDLDGAQAKSFETFQATTFPELNEPPSYFLKEVKQDKQMNFRELADYIAELRQSGFDTVRLRIQYYKKFSVPLFALILAMISVPFAFLTGSRGALAGVGVSFGIAIAYWSVNQLFEQVGQHQPTARRGGRVGPERRLLPGGDVPDGPPAHVGARRQITSTPRSGRPWWSGTSAPGFRTVDANCGWLGESGKCCVSRQKPDRLAYTLPPLPGKRPVQEVARVELNAGFGGQHFHHPPGLRLVDSRREGQRASAAGQNEVVIVAAAELELLVVLVDPGADGRRLAEIERRPFHAAQLAGRDQSPCRPA